MTSAAGTVRSRWIPAAVSMALFCVQIDCFAMNLALPRMAYELDSNATDLQWVISVYMLTLGAFMVPAGRFGDIFGRRRALLAGVALFGVASVLCTLAPSATLVIAFRVVQGLGAALIFPVSVSVLTNAFPAVGASHAIGWRTAPRCAAAGPHTIPERDDQIARRKAKGSSGCRPPPFGDAIYQQRNTVERGFNRLKQWRGVATRCDKYALTFLGGVLLAASIMRAHTLIRN